MTSALPTFTPSDVARHSTADDAWVTIRGRAFNVTPLLTPAAGFGAEAKPLIEAAGQDISHWFDAEGQQVKSFIDPVTSLLSPFLPMGRFPHVPPLAPVAWAAKWDKPWWQDEGFLVGRVSARARKLRIVNTLTAHEHSLEVAAEQTVQEIASKYLEFNAHASGYAWKVLDSSSGQPRTLDMGLTLEQNGLPDETEEMEQLGLDAEEQDLVPVILLYFKDSLTVA